jgi:hypothetical protein
MNTSVTTFGKPTQTSEQQVPSIAETTLLNTQPSESLTTTDGFPETTFVDTSSLASYTTYATLSLTSSSTTTTTMPPKVKNELSLEFCRDPPFTYFWGF